MPWREGIGEHYLVAYDAVGRSPALLSDEGKAIIYLGDDSRPIRNWDYGFIYQLDKLAIPFGAKMNISSDKKGEVSWIFGINPKLFINKNHDIVDEKAMKRMMKDIRDAFSENPWWPRKIAENGKIVVETMFRNYVNTENIDD